MYAVYKLASTAYSTYYHDIVSGSNGYSAHSGYDLVTGLGSPKAAALVAGLVNYSGTGPSVQVGGGGTQGGSQSSPPPAVVAALMSETGLAGSAVIRHETTVKIAANTAARPRTNNVDLQPAQAASTFAQLSARPDITLRLSSIVSGLGAEDSSTNDEQLPNWNATAPFAFQQRSAEAGVAISGEVPVLSGRYGVPIQQITTNGGVKWRDNETTAGAESVVEVPLVAEASESFSDECSTEPASMSAALAIAGGLAMFVGRSKSRREEAFALHAKAGVAY
jgi:hypothetical protein